MASLYVILCMAVFFAVISPALWIIEEFYLR